MEGTSLRELVTRYGNAKRFREGIEAALKRKTSPYERIVKAFKDKFKDRITEAKNDEVAARLRAQLKALDEVDKGRRVFDNGEWVQVQPPKQTAVITDLQAFLADPLAHRLIQSVVVDQAATLAMLNTGEIPGVEIEKTPKVSFHILKEA